MNVGGFREGLEKLLSVVTTLAPVAKEFGGPLVGQVADLVKTGSAIATNVLERIEERSVVADSRDEGVIRAILADLQRENDGFAAQIDAS